MNSKQHFFKDVKYSQLPWDEEPYGVEFMYRQTETDEWIKSGVTFNPNPERTHPLEFEWRKWCANGGVTAPSDEQSKITLDKFFE